MLNKKHRLILVIFILFAILLYSCSRHDNTRDLKYYVEQLKQASNKHLKSNLASPLKPPAPVTYQDDSLRPPFGNLVEMNKNSSNSKAIGANPLLAYSLSMLKFVGTLSQKGTMAAFILAPDNMIYQVNIGSEIGDHKGKVINVQEDRIEIMEQNLGSRDEQAKRIITLQLKDEH